MNIALWLTRNGLSHPGAPAVGQGPRVALSYGALAERAARLGGALRRLGLAPGDRVAIASKNCVEYVEMMFGVWHAGLAAVPANAKLHGRELGYILEHSGARVCLASKGLDEELAPYAPQRQRAVRYLEASGVQRPRFGPRFSPRDYRAI